MDRWSSLREKLPSAGEIPEFRRACHKGIIATCFSCDKPLYRSSFVRLIARDNPAIRAKEHLCKGCRDEYLSGTLTFTAERLHGWHIGE